MVEIPDQSVAEGSYKIEKNIDIFGGNYIIEL